jgi:hypothetical protein
MIKLSKQVVAMGRAVSGKLLKYVCSLLLVGCMEGVLGATCHGSEIDEKIDELTTDSKEVGKSFKREPRVVVVPIPISNPTIGTGLAVTALYLHPQKKEGSEVPITTTGVVGLYTDSESWLTGIFHDGFYAEDRYRVRGVLGYGDFKLKFYGIGNNSIFRDNPINYQARTTAFMPRVLFKLPSNKWFLGPHYSYLNLDYVFDFSGLLPGLPKRKDSSITAGMGLVAVYDSRDNNLWPREGTWFEMTATNYSENFGGDFDYNKLKLKFAQYFPLAETIIFAYRLDGQFIGGNAPFYDLSQMHLRGFPMGRYVDDSAVSGQVEGRWNFYKRWSVVLFGGAGRIGEGFKDLGSSPNLYAGGAGIRYRIKEKEKLNIGLDVTYGDGNVEFYVVVGDFLAN